MNKHTQQEGDMPATIWEISKPEDRDNKHRENAATR